MPPAAPPDILAKIAAYKAEEIAPLLRTDARAQLERAAAAQAPARGFLAALKGAAPTKPALIAEIKKASPSKGLIRGDFDVAAIARAYERGGAACLSVLTDRPSFQGDDDYVALAKANCALPVLRKDFMIDAVQITQSRALGADAILVIMAMLSDDMAARLVATAAELGMDALVETHDAAELERALALGAKLIGINNRNLRNFETSLDVFARLAPRVPDGVFLVAESGIFTPAHIVQLTQEGAQAFLIGESLMRESDVTAAVRALVG